MIEKLYGKNINFLIGSGASAGAIPTLATEYEKDGKNLSIEEILTVEKDNKNLRNLIYLYFYQKIIKTGFLEDIKDSIVMKNYEKFLEQLIKFMYRENYQKEKRINIFTTNYDLFFEKAIDNLIGKYEFYFNDGSAGNITRRLSMKNYHKKVYHTGNFDNFNREIPIINLFKVHGSVSWKYEYNEKQKIVGINVDYQDKENKLTEDILLKNLNKEEIKKILQDPENISRLENIRKNLREKFVLIFPEKDKFEKTLFEEYYYQFLRQLSYELERKNTILIAFGFSFADEHIAEMIKRACNNPTLQIFIFCYKEDNREDVLKNLHLEKFPNNIIPIIPKDNGSIDFNTFLNKLFEIESDKNGK
ncbi:SIR2 family protein [Fusobacterium sp.]|uniref:SIR2 family protein n=1 Tax=Fusobacterium sp. TaxID=68766 RepID=UPI0025B847FC|nr:SIR2 family protein [Fusobacterium sp.]